MSESTTTDSAGTQRRGAPLNAPPEFYEKPPFRTLFTAREKLKLGDRVRLKPCALQQASIFKKYRDQKCRVLTGTVIGFPGLLMIRVGLDSGDTEETNMDFWTEIPRQQKIKGLRKALANTRTPKQFKPSLRKRLKAMGA